MRPARGTLTGTPPALTYTPAPDANGTDTFTFTANDGKDQSLPATVTIDGHRGQRPAGAAAGHGHGAAPAQPVTVPAATLSANDDAGPFDERDAGADRHRRHRRVRTPTAPSTLAAGTVTFTPEAGFDRHRGDRLHGLRRRHDQRRRRSALRRLDAVDHGQPATDRQRPVGADVADRRRSRSTLSGDRPRRTTRSRSRSPRRPRHGTLTGTAPNVTYTAAAGFVGTDSFTFTAADALRHVGAGDGVDHGQRRAVADARRRLDDACAPAGRASSTCSPTTRRAAGRSTRRRWRSRRRRPRARPSCSTTGGVRYTANAGTSGTDTFSLHGVRQRRRVRHGAASPSTITRTARRSPPTTATTSRAGTTLRPAAPGVLGNDTDPDTGDALQARLRARRDERPAAAQRHRHVHVHAATGRASTRSRTASSTRRARCRTRPR